MDIVVDADLTEKSGNSYPSLDQAISALLNGSTLIEDENIITLKASCLGKNQYFPRLSQNINGNNSHLAIQFEKAPTSINSTDQCRQLPTLVLANDSCIAIDSLRSLIITGLNIKYTGDNCMNTMKNIETVAFSNFCLNNSEPSHSLPKENNRSFEIDNVTSLSMTNGVYFYDAIKQVTITQAREVTFENITLVALEMAIDSGKSAFLITGSDMVHTNLTARNFQVICEPAAHFMPSALRTSNLDQISFSGMNIRNCIFNGDGKSSPALVSVSAASTLLVEEVVLTNVTLGLNSQSVFVVSSVANASLTDFHISNLQSLPTKGENYSQIVNFNDSTPTHDPFQKYSITFAGWKITNCTLAQYQTLIHGQFRDFNYLGNVIIENFHLADSYLDWNSHIFSLQTQGAGSGTIDYERMSVTVRDIDVTNTTFRYAEMVRVSILDPKFIPAIENAHLEVTNLNLSGSSLIHGSIIHAEGFSTYISNVAVENSRFQKASHFYFSDTILSTMLMSNAIVKDITIEDYSTFASVNLTTARLTNLDKSLVGETGVYAETRPFIVYNCSFDSIQISAHSYLLASTNPMAIVQRNKFANITANNSVLIQLGNYLIFLSSESYIYDGTSRQYLNNSGTILPYPNGENAIFQHYPELGRIYNNSRKTISAYDPSNSIFFIWVNENNITNISVIDSSNLIELYNFEISNGTLGVINNSFTSISANRGINLFYCFYIKRGIFAQNSFSSMSLAGYAFMFISASLRNLLLDSNHISQTQQLAMCSITANACNQINMRNLTALNLEMELTFIDVSCVAIGRNVTIQGSTFENILQTNSPKPIMYPLDLISSLKFISVKESNLYFKRIRRPYFVFQNNYISNCTVLDTQGYTQGLYQSSLLYMVSFKAKTLLINNSFEGITTAPKGYTMTLSSPIIELSNCNLHNLSFGGTDGAIHALVETIKVKNCAFTSIRGFDSDGVGVFKFTNPEPRDLVLKIEIRNTTIRENTAAYSSVLYVKDSAIALSIDSCDISNNFLTGSGSLITIWNTTKSNISITNSRFRLHQNDIINYRDLKIVGVESSGSHVFVTISNLTIDIKGIAKGDFIAISGQKPVTLLGTQISYSAGSDGSTPQFGLFAGDNFNATFTNLEINTISLGQRGLLTINANKNLGEWRLTINDSSLKNMELHEGVIVIDTESDYGSSPAALDNLSVILQNTSISNVKWLGSSNGVVRSKIHRLGRSSDKTDVAISFKSCTFTNLTGETGLIVSTVEPMFDSVANIMNCRFYLIKARGAGAILNPSIKLLSSRAKSMRGDYNSRRNSAFRIIGNSFESISSSSGALLYWTSEFRGTYLVSQDNRFNGISCSGDGGLIFAQYLLPVGGSSNLTPATYFTLISKNDLITTISGTLSGGVIYAKGRTESFNITLTNMSLSDVECHGDGGVAHFYSPPHYISPQNQMGTVSISESRFANIAARNGGIIYESTSNSTLNLSFDSNILENVFAQQRGGAFYITKPTLSVHSNIFDNVSAQIAGPIIYSLSEQINLTDFTISNVINPPLESFASFASTNLLIRPRGCLPGEINNTATLECTRCKPGTYSLNPNDTQCSECPNGAVCHGGANITIKPRFCKINDSSTSLQIVECKNKDRDKRRLLGELFPSNYHSQNILEPSSLQSAFDNDYFFRLISEKNTYWSGQYLLIVIAVPLLLGLVVYLILMVNLRRRALYSRNTYHKKSQDSEVEEGKLPAERQAAEKSMPLESSLPEENVRFRMPTSFEINTKTQRMDDSKGTSKMDLQRNSKIIYIS